MKVLLTGASGFVGSHILDALCDHGIATSALLRPSSDRQWIRDRLGEVEIHSGQLAEPQTLKAALAGVTHVVHSAGCTKALDPNTYCAVNQILTRRLVEAANAHAPSLRLFLYISSLAASGPATSRSPATEQTASGPVTAYGRSKLAGEAEVRQGSRAPFVILRPSAVYGPRDVDFLSLFVAARSRLLPLARGGRQELSLVYVRDLAEAVVTCLSQAPPGGIYHVAEPHPVTSRRFAEEIAVQMSVRLFTPRMPALLLWLVCAVYDLASRVSGRPHVLSLQKYAELVAPGWVCSTDRLRDEVGFVCQTGYKEGIKRTLSWYRAQRWLKP